MKHLFVCSLLWGFFALGVSAQILTPNVDSIPMRDGKKLAADVYVPAGAGPFPTILIQTPYNRLFYRLSLPLGVGLQINSSNYAYVIVDWRGFYGSAGAFAVGADRGNDGYDVVEWIATQSWSNAKIGTWGPSALGKIQYQTAGKNPPNLTCICPSVAGSQQNYLEYYPGGCLRTEYLQQLDGLGFGLSPFVMAHQTYDLTWQFAENGSMYPADIKVPAFMIGGWYDHNVQVMTALFDSLQLNGDNSVKNDHKILWGPWAHGGHGTASVGGPNQGQMNYPAALGWNDSLALRFFDFYLRNIPNGWDNDPAVRYYTPGEELWYSDAQWPPTFTQETAFYLHPQGLLSTSFPIPGTDTTGSIVYDPRDPSPTIGGPTLRNDLDQGPYDQAPDVESRGDILVFTSDYLANPVGVKGHLKAILHVSSDRPDTDFAIRVTDVFPDGRSILISDGIRRMRFRNSYSTPDTIVPGNVYEIEINLPDLAYTWDTGHRIRVDISSSNYPRFDANLNNGDAMYVAGDTFTANNTVFFSTAKPSRLLLDLDTLNIITSINQPLPLTPEWKIFPNPATNQVNISSPEMVVSTVKLIDLMGKTCLQWTSPKGQSLQNISFSTSEIPTGLYLLELTTETGLKSVKRLKVDHQ